MRVLYVASEVYPLAKTGGLADVSYALPAALRSLGADIQMLVPGYPQAMERAERRRRALPLGRVMGVDDVALVPARLPGSHVAVWLLDCPALFSRSGGLYSGPDGHDWADNHLRFALLCHVGALLGAGRGPIEWQPDVVHANDWHAGLLPLLSRRYSAAAPTLFTIHNLAFQGVFSVDVADDIGVESIHLRPEGAEFYGNLSFLKAGIRFADHLATVSPSYAREITTPAFGCGLEGLLADRAGELAGILNGVDYGTWDPGHDLLIPARYSVADLAGKHICKASLQAELGLEVDPQAPLFAYASRLTEQKMADHVLAAAPRIVERGGQLVFVAQGERRFEEGFAELARQWPGRIAGRIGYEETAAHRLLAGADMLLAPARFEPCGLTQLYAMRYGTIPIVCPTGGLADTVVDVDSRTVRARTATGFYVAQSDTDGLLDTIDRAEAVRRKALAWRRLIETAMTRDFSWNRSADRYLALYRQLAGVDAAVVHEEANVARPMVH